MRSGWKEGKTTEFMSQATAKIKNIGKRLLRGIGSLQAARLNELSKEIGKRKQYTVYLRIKRERKKC